MPLSEPKEQHVEDQDDRRIGQASASRYQLRQKMVSITSDYWIENEQGKQVYKINGKLGLHKSFIFEDTHGNTLAKIHKDILTVKETMQVEGPNGDQLAVVKKALFTPLKEHFVVNMKNGLELQIHGNLLDYDYTISDRINKVAEVSKKYFHLRDSYSVLIEPGYDDIVILAIVVCIDEMTHAGK
jgi:uncharacterized protein YxjI